MENTLHFALLEAVKKRVPEGTSIARLLMDILHVGREAIYRRLRGEVLFSFDEAVAISTRMAISLDTVVGCNMQNSRPFMLKVTNFVNPQEQDFEQLEEFTNIISDAREELNSEMGVSANILPQTLYIEFEHLTKFYFLKWLYQSQRIGNVKSIKEIKISDRMYDIQKRYLKESKYLKNTYYIFDNLIFTYLINDIKYYARIHHITKGDVVILKQELLMLVDKLETLAIRGRFDTGEKVQFYLSAINLEATYSYLQTQSYNISHITAFTLNAVVSLDLETFEKMKRWIESVKRLSTLISESGEMERTIFFNKQRELINSL